MHTLCHVKYWLAQVLIRRHHQDPKYGPRFIPYELQQIHHHHPQLHALDTLLTDIFQKTKAYVLISKLVRKPGSHQEHVKK